MKHFYSSNSKMNVRSFIFIFVLSCFSFKNINAQAGAYTFAAAGGAALNAMAGSTSLVPAASDDVASAVTNIGFTFTFACTNYTQFSATSNGLMGLGGTVVSSSFNNGITASGSYPIIMPFWDDMHTCTTGKVHYLLSGGSPNRVLTVEWLFGNFGESGAAYKKTVQVKLYETSNVIEIVYGANSGAAPAGGSVGIASSSSSYQSVSTATNTSSNAVANDVNTAWTSGEKYTFTPAGAMAYSSSTVTQASVATLTKCATDQAIICLQVVTTGACTPISLTQIKMQMSGTAPTTDVSLIHIYYTGTTNAFSAIGAFDGAGTAVAAGTITINGAQTLSNGTNYFWVAYDMNSAGVTGHNVDALLLASPTTTITVAGVARTVTANDPVGNRTSTACPVAPGGISSGINLWLKANAGVTTAGVNVTAWADQSSAATAVTVNGSPDYTSPGYNNNPYINFTLSNVGATGGDYLHTADQNIRSFFVVAKLSDLTRKSTHMLTYDNVTFSGPCALCAIHGGENGTSIPEYGEFTYGNANFQTAGVWRKNGDPTGIVYSTPHSGSYDIVTALGGGTGSVNSYFGGQIDNLPGFNGRMRDWYGPVGELITYTGAISTTQANKVESYLAVKYGITLGGNGSTTLAYTSTTGTTIWTANSGYHYDVTGIGAESTESLQQNKSASLNVPSAAGATDMPFTIAHDLISAPTNIGDGTYILVGHNNGNLYGNVIAYTHGGAVMQVEQNRIFRIQTTSLTGGHSVMNMVNLEIQFDMSQVPGNSGGFGLAAAVNDPTKLRLLLDDNTTFGQGTANEKAYSYSALAGNVINFKIPVADLAATGTMFFRIGSTDFSAAPLPVELVSFTPTCTNNFVNVDWVVATQTNSDYFTIERSADATDYTAVGTVAAAGNSTQTLHYTWVDHNPLAENSYYRLREIDKDGKSKIFAPASVSCPNNNSSGLQITSTNINEGQLFFNCSTSFEGNHLIYVYDDLGNLLKMEESFLSPGVNALTMNISNYSGGIYILRVANEQHSVTKKIMVIK